jgi:hypothetical protein
MREEHLGVLDRRKDVYYPLNEPFTMAEVKRAIGKAGLTSPGKDEVCYVMLAHLSDKVLVLYNTVRQLEGGSSGTTPEAREGPNEANRLLANSFNTSCIFYIFYLFLFHLYLTR